MKAKILEKFKIGTENCASAEHINKQIKIKLQTAYLKLFGKKTRTS